MEQCLRKGQEMDDHYLGTIRQRISAYMKEVNEECWKLGISAKTQHNEVAPAQHELAPIYAGCKCCSGPQPDDDADSQESGEPSWNALPSS